MPVEWNSYLAIGVERIDNQHKEIFRRVNEFMDAINQGNGPLRVTEVLNYLNSYTLTHFRDEEEIMEKTHYLCYDFHKREHEKFCKDILKLQEQIALKGVNMVSVLQTSHVMVKWLVQHIMETDKALADHMRSSNS